MRQRHRHPPKLNPTRNRNLNLNLNQTLTYYAQLEYRIKFGHYKIKFSLAPLALYYSTVGLLKPTLVTNSNYLNLVRNKNLNFPDFSCLFFPITMKLFLLIQHKGFKCKMRVFDKFFKILPISSFRCKILILRIIFLVEIKRIRVKWCPRLDGLQ